MNGPVSNLEQQTRVIRRARALSRCGLLSFSLVLRVKFVRIVIHLFWGRVGVGRVYEYTFPTHALPFDA